MNIALKYLSTLFHYPQILKTADLNFMQLRIYSILYCSIELTEPLGKFSGLLSLKIKP